jgi:hypothetical protein
MRPLCRLRRLVALALTFSSAAGFGFVLRAQNPQAVNTWAVLGAAPQPRTGAGAVVLDDRRVVVAGGTAADGSVTDSVIVFDPNTNQVSSAGQLLAPRAGHTATLLNDGRILVVGGTVDGVISADLEAVDLASGTSTLVATLIEARTGHAAAALPDGKVLIVGGAAVDDVVLRSAELFDPERLTVGPVVGSLQVARRDASATTLLDGRVLVAGGNDGAQDLASAEIFEPSSGLFGLLDPGNHLSVPRGGHTATLLPHNNSVLISGGRSNGLAVATADLFAPPIFPDPYTFGVGQFAPTSELTNPRTGAIGGPLASDGYAFVLGGGPADAEVYRFATIKTDKDDYAPGERALITGSGWGPGEDVTLIFQEDPAVHPDYVLHVTADSQGNIYWDQWAPEEHDLNVRFYLTAVDSSSHVQMTFTDSRPGSVSLTPSTVSITSGGTATYEVKVAHSGSGSACSITMGAVYTGVPAVGSVFSFSPNPVSMTSGDVFTTLTVTTTNSGPTSGVTAPGTYPFTVTATPGPGPGCQGNRVSSAGTLVVNPPTTVPTLSAAAANGTYGGSVTLSATLTTAGSALDGKTVSFTLNGSGVGSATTNAAGVATLDDVSLAGIDAASYPSGVGASFAGDSSLLPANGSSSLTVSKADATVSVTGYTGAYDGDAHGATGSAAGVNGEDLSSLLHLGASFTDAPGGAADWSFDGNNNYEPASGTVQVTISRAHASISVTGYSGIYDGNAHGAIGTATGVKGEDLHGLFDLGASFTDVPGGTVDWTFAGNGNYEAASGSVQVAISKADASIVVTGYTGVYDGNAHGAIGTATGVKGEDLHGLFDLGASFTNVPGGTVDWTFAGNGNYKPANGSVQVEISKANANISVSGYTGVYDGDPHGATGTATGVKGENLQGLLDLGATFTNVPGGTATWTFAGNGNYAANSGSAAVVLTKAAQVIAWPTPAPIIYGEALGTAQLNATVTKGDGGLTYSPDAGSVLAVGEQVLQVTAAATTNYNEAVAQVTLLVAPWHVTGFYTPVTMGGPAFVNTVKGGSTVPLKFNLYKKAGGTELTSTSDVGGFQVYQIGCSADTFEDPIDMTATGGTSLRYDSIARQFIQNWQTPKGGGFCYKVTMIAKDGTSIAAFFKTK